jgi:tetratricopeptide (TPR) repeat protein
MGQPAKAGALCERLLKHNPRQGDALHILGILAHQAGRLDDARRLMTRAVAADPRNADFHSNLGGVLHELKQHERAVESCDRALALQPDLAVAHYKRGLALYALGRYLDAVEAFSRTIALDSRFAAACYDRALALHADRRPAEAIADFDQAIALTGGDAEMRYNRANTLLDLGRREDAIADYDHAITLDPALVAAHFNRGKALAALGRRGEALESLRRVLVLDPDNAVARKTLLWLEIADPSPDTDLEALIAQTCAATAAQDARRLSACRTIPTFRVRHDLEQSAYLLALEGETPDREDLRRAHETLKIIEGRRPRGGVHQISEAEAETINRARNRLRRAAVGGGVTDCLNPANDWASLEAQYLAGRPEIVVIDNLLTEEALLALRGFCLGSTVWNAEYDNHYLGAFAVDGFVNDIVLRISREFHEKMPQVFSGHALEEIWAFKYDSRMARGINVHADFARVNLNFWITPDEANLDPTSGGLVIYDTPAPQTWSFQEYNSEPERIYAFLEANQAGKRIVPYRCNRAVLFNSNLFHETDAIHFKEGYENRRINITCLFGRFAEWAV